MRFKTITFLQLTAIYCTCRYACPANADLVGLWRFEDGFTDTSVCKNDGTATGTVAFASGKYGQSVNIVSSNGRIIVPDSSSLDITGPLTIAAWINVQIASGTEQYLLTKGPPETGSTDDNQPGNYEFRLVKNAETNGTKQLQACWRNKDGITNSLPAAGGSVTIRSNEWTHIAIVWSDGTLIFYINGAACYSLNDPDLGMTNNNPLTIGNRANTGTRPILGQIDDLAVFNEALDRNSVLQIMSGDFSNFLAPATEQNEVDYRTDFSGTTLPENWLYLWSSSISNESSFAALEPDSGGTCWKTVNSTDPQLKLDATGVCPGSSVSNTYVIAGYQIQSSGRYFLEDTFLKLISGASDGVELRVFVNNETPLLTEMVLSTNQMSFDTDLGLLHAGDTVYVALGPNGNAQNDACLWDFSIDRKPTWYSSGYPDPIEIPVYTKRPLNELDIFTNGQPRPFTFRNDYLGNKPYDYFYNTVIQSYGHAPKMFSEELISSVNNQPYMTSLTMSDPGMLLLCHYNFQEIKIMAQLEFAEFAPAHWLYYPGSTLTSPLASTATVMTVASSSNFIYKNSSDAVSNSVLALIPLDINGNRLWAQTEYVALRSKSGGTVTVDRGLFRTSARDFPSGTVIAVLPDLYMGETDTVFQFNWSSDCPLDAKGRNCGDVFVHMMASYFHPGQPLEYIHGILSDVLFCVLGSPLSSGETTQRYYDTNGDGLADNGYNSEGVNRFGLGVYDMCRKLRSALGSDRIFCADGNGSSWARFPNLMNGIESEGLSYYNDPYATDWSSNINRYRYWQAHAGFEHSLNYIVDKLVSLTDEELAEDGLHLQRLAGAVAAILDAGVSARGVEKVSSSRAYELYDHLKQGIVNRLGWLGQADEWMRPAADTTNLFSGGASDWVSGNATIVQDAEEDAWHIQTTGDPFGPSTDMTIISLTGQEVPAGDLFIRCRVKAAPFTWFPSNVFRYVYATVTGRLPNSSTVDYPDGIASTEGYSELCFYFRDVSFLGGRSTGNITISLGIEGAQDFWIKDFSVHNATDILVRGFDNGVVLANPRNDTFTFNLKELFPDRICWRLTGNEWEDPDTNSGEPVGSTVIVPALDGLFLRSEPDADYDGLSDRWELKYATDLTALDGTSGIADSDNDGITDQQEHLAGTNPLDAASSFMVSGTFLYDKIFYFEWLGVQNHKYTLWWTAILGNEWMLLDTVNHTTADSPVSLQLTPPESPTNSVQKGFFRIQTTPL